MKYVLIIISFLAACTVVTGDNNRIDKDHGIVTEVDK